MRGLGGNKQSWREDRNIHTTSEYARDENRKLGTESVD